MAVEPPGFDLEEAALHQGLLHAQAAPARLTGRGWGAGAAGGESVLAVGGVWRHRGRGRAAQVRHRLVWLQLLESVSWTTGCGGMGRGSVVLWGDVVCCSNRSLALLKANQPGAAVEAANCCIELKPQWSKGEHGLSKLSSIRDCGPWDSARPSHMAGRLARISRLPRLLPRGVPCALLPFCGAFGLGAGSNRRDRCVPSPHRGAGFFRRGEAYCGLLDFQKAIRDFEGAVELSLPAVDSVLAARLTSAHEALQEQQRLLELEQEVDSQRAKDKAIAEVRRCECGCRVSLPDSGKSRPLRHACTPRAGGELQHQGQTPRLALLARIEAWVGGWRCRRTRTRRSRRCKTRQRSGETTVFVCLGAHRAKLEKARGGMMPNRHLGGPYVSGSAIRR